jgi:hypothetical protein
MRGSQQENGGEDDFLLIADAALSRSRTDRSRDGLKINAKRRMLEGWR